MIWHTCTRRAALAALVAAGVSAVVLAKGGAAAQSAKVDAPATPPAAADARAVLDKYCVTCHNEQRKTAGLMLDRMDVADVSDGTEVWEKVVRKLHAREMPPKGMPQPDPAVR